MAGGICMKSRKCAFGDDGFNVAQDAVAQSDAVAMITPVYWNESLEQRL
jgi:multimeric flavodoxin WrbA